MNKKIYQEPSIKSVIALLKVNIMQFDEPETESIPLNPSVPVDPGEGLAPEAKNVWDTEGEE